ncbi:MAG: putative immunity protein [Dehalococcoidia bacterium]
MKLFKLTDQDGYTRRGEEGETKWTPGFAFTQKPCDNPRLCSSDVVHAYTNANLAFLLNPDHANLQNPQLWEAEGEIVVNDWGKVGCFQLTTLKKKDTPVWVKRCANDVQVRFAILCAESALHFFEDKYPKDDRPRKAIEAAKEYLKTKTASYASYASYAARAAAHAAYAASAASYAASATSYAASATFYAASAASYAARAAAYAASAADAAASAASYAAYAAHAAYAADIDFGVLANKAVDLAMQGVI